MDIKIYKDFFEFNDELFGISDLEGNIIKLNSAWESALGYNADEMEGKNFLDFLHPDDYEKTKLSMARLIVENIDDTIINRYRHKDGSYKNLHWSTKISNNFVFSSVRDVTDCISKQNSTLTHFDNFKSFFEKMDDLIFVVTEKGEVINANLKVSEKLGYSKDELVQMNILELHPEIYREEALKIFEDMFNGHRNFCPLPLKKKDGSFLPVETRIWFGKWNNIDCMFGISKDLSIQQEALEKFQKIFDINPALMALSDISKGEFIDVNETFLKVLGFKKDEVIGKTSKELKLFFNESDRDKLAKRLSKKGYIYEEEVIIKKKDGSKLNGLFYGNLIDNQGVKNFLTVMVDITEQKKNEIEIIRAKEQAEMANNMKSRFLANMSHEIRTPLNGILGFIELFSDTNMTDEQKEYLSDTRTASETLLNIINDVLDFSKIEAGRLHLENEIIDLKGLINEVVNIMTPSAKNKKIYLNSKFLNNVPNYVYGDSSRIKQILTNLLSNAIKFTSHGGVDILIEGNKIDLNHVNIKFCIRDTGIGINEESLENIFEPFIQADTSTTRKFGGTGLGLAITKELVDMMEGKIIVKSLKKEGSVFEVLIPFLVSSEKIINKADVYLYDPNKFKQSKVKILLVEDNEMNRRLFHKAITKKGFECDTAENGYEAIEILTEKEYDIIFMDCQMPGMDGYETTNKIRKMKGSNKDAYIVAVTANAMKGAKEKCLSEGMDEYISKPINFNVLYNIIEKHIGRNELNIYNYFSDSIEMFIIDSGLSRQDVEPLYLQFHNFITNGIEILENLFDDEDYEGLLKLIHQIKGSSSNLRIKKIFSIVDKMEQNVKERKMEDGRILIKKLKNLVNN